MKEISQPKKEVKHNIKHDILRQKKAWQKRRRTFIETF